LLEQKYTFLVVSVLVLILGTILGVTVFKYTLRPLNNTTNTIENINIDQLNIRLPIETGQIEIDRLSKAFNNMLERIEISFEMEQKTKDKMRQFVSDASHELRTPLTSIHGFVEVLLRGAAKDEAKLDLALKSILMESERLAKLVSDLLLLTKLDRQVPVEVKIENINDIIKELYPQLKIFCGERNINLQLVDNIFARVNRNQIKQIVINLVQNAVHHTDEKLGTIIVSTSSQEINSEDYAVLKVIDNGAGISEQHVKNIFDRFFRIESHRSRKQGGYGLGLSIVKSIVEAHEGEIHVQSEISKGTTFSIYLKLIK
jgi:two-component system, OmpR family, sensor kinase